jgi:hypothetical protein
MSGPLGRLDRMVMTMNLALASHLYLFTTHITRTKIIAGVAVVIVVAVAGVVWLVMRRRGNARQV